VVLFVAAVLVQLTHAGIDLFLMLVAGFVLLVLERTLGDWIAETVGAPGAALIFTLFAALVVGYGLTADGRAKASRLFATAESHGYRPLYFVVNEPATSPDGKTLARDVADGAVGLAGSRAPAASDSQGPAPTPTSGAPVSPGIFDWSGTSKDRGVHLRLRAEPDVLVTGQIVTLRATLESAARPEGALAVFTVNGSVVARVAFDGSGNASTRFAAEVPGLYTVRSRVTPGSIFGQDVSTTFNVLPGGSPRVPKRP